MSAVIKLANFMSSRTSRTSSDVRDSRFARGRRCSTLFEVKRYARVAWLRHRYSPSNCSRCAH
eukprot:4015172-Prymnesium_polylepis.1